MTVYILVVEDEVDFSNELRQVFAELPGIIDVQYASSRDSAMSLMASDFYDLIVLDLRIPTVDGALDAEPKHGHAVFAYARFVAPGTPIFILTGSPVEDFVPAILEQKEHLDIWGEGSRVGTIDFLTKLRFEDCPARLGPIVAAVHGLSEVELNRGGINLTLPEERLIRIFTRRSRGAHCRVSQLGGGLSGARVFRLKVTDAAGTCVHDAVAKLGSPAEIRDEADRFARLVSRLNPSATPRMLAHLDFGARDIAGVFYGLAEGFESSAFDMVPLQDGRAAAAVSAISRATSPWRAGVPQTRLSIMAIRHKILPDEVLAGVVRAFPLDWITSFEQTKIQTCWATVHGDLHGSNALISNSGAACLIDYGDVADGPASLDPITLELSILFHPQRISLMAWPTLEQARHWGRLDIYLESCPAAEFIRACREWALEAAAGQREIAAVAYSYLLRQLKYDDTDKELALALLEGAKRYYDEET